MRIRTAPAVPAVLAVLVVACLQAPSRGNRDAGDAPGADIPQEDPSGVPEEAADTATDDVPDPGDVPETWDPGPQPEVQEDCGGCTVYFRDGDEDGFGVDGDSRCLCAPWKPYTAIDAGDCDDSDVSIHPGATANCGKDANCDGSLLDPGEVCDDGPEEGWDGCYQCVPSEFQVNAFTTGDQWAPSVAAFPDGSFVVVWTSGAEGLAGQDGSGTGVFGRRYDAAGKPGAEFQVSGATIGDQEAPRVAAFGDGRFVVVWQSRSGAGADWDVFARRFKAPVLGGGPDGDEIEVPQHGTGDQVAPAVAILPSGGFAVTWAGPGESEAFGKDVFLRVFDAAGAPQNSDERVNTYTTGDQWRPAIGSTDEGDLVIVWSSWEQDGSEDGAFGQRFRSTGGLVGDEFAVNATTAWSQSNPVLAVDPGGSFVAGWSAPTGSGVVEVYARPFDGETVPGAEMTLGQAEAPNARVELALAPAVGGNWWAAWAAGEPGQRSSIRLRGFDEGQQPLGDEKTVSTYPYERLAEPSVAFAGGHAVVVWTAPMQDGDGRGIFGRVMTP